MVSLGVYLSSGFLLLEDSSAAFFLFHHGALTFRSSSSPKQLPLVPQTCPGAQLSSTRSLPPLLSPQFVCPEDLITLLSHGTVPISLSFRQDSGMALLAIVLSSLLADKLESLSWLCHRHGLWVALFRVLFLRRYVEIRTYGAITLWLTLLLNYLSLR